MIFLVGNNLKFPKLTNIKQRPSSLNHLRVSCQPAAPSPQTIQVCNSCKRRHSPSEPQHSWMIRKLALTYHDSVILRPLSGFAKCLNNALWAAGASSGSHVGAPSSPGWFLLSFLLFSWSGLLLRNTGFWKHPSWVCLMIGFTRCIIVRTAAEVRLCLSTVSFIRNEIKGKTEVIYCVPATGWHWATCFICWTHFVLTRGTVHYAHHSS